MVDPVQDLQSSMAELNKREWLAAVQQRTEAGGEFEDLGRHHYAALVDRGDTLLVSFETLQGIRALSTEAHPLGWRMTAKEGWSHLLIASDGDTWFRDQSVYGYFDRLIDDGFFDNFETILFYGAGPCGYAAAAYSVAAPGARVLAVQPQATLDPRVTEWDDRFIEMRRTDFTNRFGYAPDMLDGAEKAFVLYDPAEALDAMHAALFTRSNVQKLRLRFMGDAIQTDLLEMGIWDDLLRALADDTLNDAVFAAALRARRDHPPYLRNLMGVLETQGRERLLLGLARNVTGRMNAPRFARRLAQLEASAES